MKLLFHSASPHPRGVGIIDDAKSAATSHRSDINPVGAGLRKSLAHPGGDVTGKRIPGPDLNSRRLQLK
jgi:hypothetical protein